MKRVLRDRLRQQAVITLLSGDTFAGVLWDWDSQAFVLRQASQVVPGEAPIPADGELVFLAAQVSIVQVIP